MAVTLGDIEFDRRHMIGWGPKGTVVLRGIFKGQQQQQQPVAVKRFITKQLHWNADEFELYRKEDHANIVRLYHFTSVDRSGFTYFALELCACNLADYLAGKYRGPALSSHTILLQISNGLQHLHSMDVIHRGLKPNNVLISHRKPNDCGGDEIQIKLSDFGVMASNSLSDSWPCADMDNVDGWLAPEQIKTMGQQLTTKGRNSTTSLHRQKSVVVGRGGGLILTPAVDVFALGCLFFCVLTSGQHPFGSPSYFRDQKALAGHYDLAPVNIQLPAAAILIERMIQRDPDYRPTIDDILAQSNFWSLDI